MDPRFIRILRPIAAVTVFVFTWISFEPWNYAAAFQASRSAHAAQLSGKPKTVASAKQSRSTGKLEENLLEVETLLGELDQKIAEGKDITLSIESVKGHRQALEAEDKRTMESFFETESFLKDRKVPSSILERHRKALAEYQNSFDAIHERFEGLLALNDAAEEARVQGNREVFTERRQALRQTLQALREELKEKVRRPKSRPLDPENLPFRTPQINSKKPRLKKLEFTEVYQPIQLAYNGDLLDLLLVSDSTGDLPEAADLAETIEVQFTPEINALAMELEHNPVKIYNWVHNNIDFTPTWGSIQGANHCLLTKQCNAFDTSSLLIALLRTSGIPARYVMGTIEIPLAQAANWVEGFTEQNEAIQFIGTNGVPIDSIGAGVGGYSIRMEHIWAEGYVDYLPSRGAVHKEGDTWISMDGSFKQYTYTDPISLPDAVGFDVDAFIAEVASQSAVDPATSSVSNVPQGLILQRMQEYVQAVSNSMGSDPGRKLSDVVGTKRVKPQQLSALPADLPYAVLVEAGPFSVIPDGLRHKIQIKAVTGSVLDPDFVYTASFPDLAGKRMTVSYVPAAADDEVVLAEYGSIEASPPYLLELKTQLNIEGVQVAIGKSVGAGKDVAFSFLFSGPVSWTNAWIEKTEIAGAYFAIGFNLNDIPKGLLEERLARLESAFQSPGAPVDETVGETLHLLSILRFAKVDARVSISARFANMVYSKYPSAVIVAEGLRVTGAFSPTSLKFTGLFMDGFHHLYNPRAKDGNRDRAKRFLIEAGFIASGSEHATFEQVYNVPAVSTMRVLQLSNERGMPIYEMNKLNKSTILPLLEHTVEVMEEIEALVDVGKKVIIPQSPIQHYDWFGTGYIVLDPASGAAAYRITGAINGGEVALSQECIESIRQLVYQYRAPLSGSEDSAVRTALNILAYVSAATDITQESEETAWLVNWLAMNDCMCDILEENSNLTELVSRSITDVISFLSEQALYQGQVPTLAQEVVEDCSDLIIYEVRLEQIGPTVIEPGNNYSENTTLRATVLYPEGHPLAGQTAELYNGQIVFIEEEGTEYYRGEGGATSLPQPLDVVGGVGSMTVKSLSNFISDIGVPPAKIIAVGVNTAKQAGTNPIEIAQWVKSGGDPNKIDWLEQHVDKILSEAAGAGNEIAVVVSRITSWEQRPIGSCGSTPPQSFRIRISPVCTDDPDANFNYHRVNSDLQLTSTVLHEARHAWQNYQEQRPDFGVLDNPDSLPYPITWPNDEDRDHFVDQVEFDSARILLEVEQPLGSKSDLTFDPGGEDVQEQGDAEPFGQANRFCCP